MTDESTDTLAEQRKELQQEYKNLLPAFYSITDIALAKLDVLQKAIDEKTLSENNDEAEKNVQTAFMDYQEIKHVKDAQKQKLEDVLSKLDPLISGMIAGLDESSEEEY
eukprot:GEMP01078755.1.p1 GENE.GEMP01078755.1~~GEMP01078755.1.p1  ORF type:complete len:109 (+),score=14.66 GEMP01078755.1:163-489(+)